VLESQAAAFGTPAAEGGVFDLSHVETVTIEIASAIKGYKLIPKKEHDTSLHVRMKWKAVNRGNRRHHGHRVRLSTSVLEVAAGSLGAILIEQ
jgi:hypothetical protein